MVRAPCCEKMGLKKGPWASEEDQILISYIQNYGHSNWRALPKQAGLLRCGKSCRLRWMNYLKPDIKRGNFTTQEEETIIKLHELLGNRWSRIAASLPGRTDNEIKNVWHTHLKKKLNQTKPKSINQLNIVKEPKYEDSNSDSRSYHASTSSQPSSSNNMSPSTTSDVIDDHITPRVNIKGEQHDNDTSSQYELHEIDESFWSDALSGETVYQSSRFEQEFCYDTHEVTNNEYKTCVPKIGDDGGMEFWYDLFARAEGGKELPEF